MKSVRTPNAIAGVLLLIMTPFIQGIVVTLCAILLVLVILTRGAILKFIWFLIVVGLYKLIGKNPFA